MTLSDAGAASAPSDVASAPPTTDLPAAWHRQLESVAKGIVNNEARRLNFTEPAGVADVTRRLNGYAWKTVGAGLSPLRHPLADRRVRHRPAVARRPSAQPPWFLRIAARRNRSWVSAPRPPWSRIATRVSSRPGLRPRPVKEVAAQYSVSEATVKRVATPLAVAAWRQHQAVEVSEPFSPPLPDDSQNETNFLESSEHRIEKGSDTSDHSWIVDTWIAAVGRAPTLRQQLQLGAWCSAGEDDLTLVDLVRMITYARDKRDPWAYVAAGMARLAGEPEWWQSLQRRASNKQRQYARRADNPRAYLATCIRGAGEKRQPDAVPPDRCGYIDEVRRVYGRLPWDPVQPG